MWNVDTDGYYSATNRKYLQVAWIGTKTKKEEYLEFQAALSIAKYLDRILIGPIFKCKRGNTSIDCPLYAYIGDVDRQPEHKFSVYNDLREHYFLLHPLVPESVRQSTTNIFYAKNDSSVTLEAIDKFDMFKHFQISCTHWNSIKKFINFNYIKSLQV